MTPRHIVTIAAVFQLLSITCAATAAVQTTDSRSVPERAVGNSDAEAIEAKGPACVIPAPVSYEISDGSFSLSHGISFYIDAPDSAPPYGPSSWKDTESESYTLEVRPDKVLIDAPSFAGAFYALQTLRQMGPEIRCCKVSDSPEFGYRGLHFDVSRHFRSKEFLMKQMDAMALLKLNKMHLHLTDGAGWRIEIEGYPRLTDFAAWRPYRKWSDWWVSDRHYLLYCTGYKGNT